MGGHVVRIGDGSRAHRLFLRKPEGRCPRGWLKISWKDNIIWDLKEVDYEGGWKTFAQIVTWRAYVLAAMNLWVS